MAIVEENSVVTHWPDADELLAKGQELISKPAYHVKPDAMAKYEAYFEEKCQKSKASTAAAAQFIPGGIQHNLAFNHPFALDIVKADGAHLWDADGNKYIDFLQAGGPTVLGSNYGPVREKVIEVINECGPVTGLFHEYEAKLAELICKHVPSVELFRMLGSGTEACMAAIRASRNFTEKRKVIKVGGCYHGWSDQLVYSIRIPGLGAFDAHGIPAECIEHTTEIFPNDISGMEELFKKNAEDGGSAALIVEPIGPESGSRPLSREFLTRMRELCTEYGTMLIYDEVVSGFRLGLGGAQELFGITPDLTVFGKCVAGGYPAAGGVGGRKDVMSTFAAGIGGSGTRTMVGGTLSANPISCAAGYYSILEMERTNAPAIASRAADRLCEGVNAVIEDAGLPFYAYNYGSVLHLQTTGILLLDITDPEFMIKVFTRKDIAEKIGAAYTAEGIITVGGSRVYTSMADTDEVIDDAIERFARTLNNMEAVE